MKKIILLLALIVLPLTAAAQDQREILLTGDGTLFVAQPRLGSTSPDVDSAVITYIQLTVRRGEETTEMIVPGTLEPGVHNGPALAYDNTSHTLFVFWRRSLSLLHSELLFQALGPDMDWGPIASLGSVQNNRQNLRIAVTRKAVEPGADGETTLVPQVNVHAVWWEFDAYDGTQSARYAMLTLENGTVIDSSVHNLYEFLDATDKTVSPDAEVADVFKHPSLTVSPQQDSVSVIFGDLRDGSFNRVRISPWKTTSDARVHIPVGRSEGKLGAPRMSVASEARVETFTAGNDRIAMVTDSANAISYTLYRDGQWSEQRELRLDGDITRDAALNAVRRLIEHE